MLSLSSRIITVHCLKVSFPMKSTAWLQKENSLRILMMTLHYRIQMMMMMMTRSVSGGDHHSLDPVSGVLRESESSMLSVAQVFAQLAAGPFLHTAVPLQSTSWHS